MRVRLTSSNTGYAALLFALALLVSACGSSDTSTESADGGGFEAASGELATLAGEFDTVAGDTIDLSTLVDSDVVLWYWAPW